MIRRRTTSWVVKGLFVLLIGAFAAWGIGDIFRNTGNRAAIIEIGSDFRYDQQDFDRDLRQALDQFSRTTGNPLTTQQFAAIGGVDQLLQRALSNALLRTYASEMKLSVPQTTAIAEIQAQQIFRNEFGQFDRARFEQILTGIGLSEAAYVQSVRSDLRDQWVLDAYFSSASLPEKAVDESYKISATERSALILRIPATTINDIPSPDDATLTAYYDERKDSYKTPAYKSFELIHLKPEDLVADISVSDDEIAQEYSARQTEYSRPEMRDIEQIVLPGEEEAGQLSALIKAEGDFAKAVEKQLQTKPIKIGLVTKDSLPKDIAQTAFTLAEGDVSTPIKSSLGYHIIHVLKVEPGLTQPIETVKEEIKKSIALAKASDQMGDLVNKLDDKLAGGASLGEAVGAIGHKTVRIDDITRTGETKGQEALDLSDDVLSFLWGDETASNQVNQLADGSYLIFNIVNSQEPQAQDFATVKAAVSNDWLADEAQKRATALALSAATEIKTIGDLETFAAARKLTIEKADGITRFQGQAEHGIDAAFAATIFDGPLAAAVAGTDVVGGILAFVTEEKPTAIEGDGYNQFKDQYRQSLRSDLARVFAKALEKQMDVTVRRELVEQSLQ